MSELPKPTYRIVSLTPAGRAAIQDKSLRRYLPPETVRLLADHGYGPAKFEAEE